MMEKILNRIQKKKKRLVQMMMFSMLLLLAVSFPIKGERNVYAKEIEEIHTFEDFFIFAQASQSYDYDGVEVKLFKDFDLSDEEIKTMLTKYNVEHLTIGTKDRPFKGTFNGQNHFIKDLIYDPGIIKDPNSGLFSFTDGATIKNLTLKDSSIECVYQGGNIVGHAKNTHLENLTVLNSKLKIAPANNVISLITNLGFCGGGIAGIMENSTMYNCELSGSEVVNNNTSGVTGVGGEGLYMGGLVGWAEDSVIEYSRVRSNYVNENGTEEIRHSQVRNDYDIAVGALGGKSLYAGGIVGGVNTTKNGETRIIDCFSTADVSFYAANYVSVGSGIAGYGGGITGALRGNSHIERCHYAGNIHSKQYNAVLVIPIIQNDVNISGISNVNKGSTSVTNSYFKRSASATKKKIQAVGTKDDSDSYAAKTDAEYIDPEFWKSKKYDLIGTIKRTSRNFGGKVHINKWVMDYDLGIPVHGNSVYATFDFPGAATVKINKTALINGEVETADAYKFASQGIHPRGDQNVTMQVIPANVDDSQEDEYKFIGWYLHPEKIVKDYVDEMSELEKVTHVPEGKPDCDKLELTVEVAPNGIDRNLYIACMKAKVQFFDVEGNPMKVDHYTYRQPLEDLKPNNPPDQTQFYGWATTPNKDGKGYNGISADVLAKLEKDGAVYHGNEPVEKPLKLYPIYTSHITDVVTIFEGHENDTVDLVAQREGVGATSTGVEKETGKVFINVTGVGTDGAFPEGYRFLGWYEENAEGKEVRVSKEQKYYVTDLTKKHTYTARFEYQLQYYANLKDPELADGHEYGYWNFHNEWVRYQTPFNGDYATEIAAKDYDHRINHWSLINNGSALCGDANKDGFADKTKIIQPENLYGHWTGDGTSQIVLYSDFPNAAKLSMIGHENNLTFNAEVYPGYEFKFWAEEREDNKKWTSTEKSWNSGQHWNLKKYRVEGHFVADIKFHLKENDETKVVKRRYQDLLMYPKENFEEYTYPFSTDSIVKEEFAKLKRLPAPRDSEMAIKNANGEIDPNYEFLGWIQGKTTTEGSPVIRGGIEMGGAEWKHIYDVENDEYCTSDATKALPYILPDNAKVTETMDLYPVYVKYSVKTTTNIAQMVDNPEGIHIPTNPTFTISQEEAGEQSKKGVAKVTVVAHTNTEKVRTDQEDPTTYQLVGMKCNVSDGRVINLWNSGKPNAQESPTNYTFEMNMEGGKQYEFVAIYNPAFLLYHTDVGTTHLETRNVGEKVGTMPQPNFSNPDLKKAYMVGWTEKRPEQNWYHLYDNQGALEAAKINRVTPETVVEKSMEMWPVFLRVNLTVNSNIDDQLGDRASQVRYIENRKNQFVAVAKDCDGYIFRGWKEDVASEHYVTETAEYVIPENDLFSGKTFTAIYEEAIDIRYHDFDGKILYTAKTTKEEKRSFVEIIQKPSVEGKPGTQQEVEVPIDIEAFELIQQQIDQMAEENQTNIRFVEWRLEQSGEAGTEKQYLGWKDFKDRPIEQDVDLYPVAYEVGFYHPDTKNPETQGDVYTGMDYSVNNENGEKGIDAVFTTEYRDDRIFISTTEQTWENGKSVTRGLVGIHTDVYMAGPPDQNNHPTFVIASEGTVDTDESGIAMHKLYGKLTVKKQYGVMKPNDTIIIQLQRVDENQKPIGERLEVPITVRDGEGTIDMRLPVGTYVVAEDLKWAWRDQCTTITKDGVIQERKNGISGSTEVPIDVLSSKVVVFGNVRQTQKWFSDFCEKKNEFKVPDAGGQQ